MIHPAQAKDVPALQRIVGETGLFPPDLLPEMIADHLAGEAGDIWLSCTVQDHVAGFCYAVPEQMTDGVWNMLALAADPARQRSGVGHKLVADLEERLSAQNARLIVVDTSSDAMFEGARAFYAKAGYTEEARIRDFWGPGDDKITFRKAL